MKFIFHLDQYKIEKSSSGPPTITKIPQLGKIWDQISMDNSMLLDLIRCYALRKVNKYLFQATQDLMCTNFST